MPGREPDHILEKLANKQEQHLLPLKEDLADWLNKTLGRTDITAHNFMDKLDNGIVVCQLAQLVQKQAEEHYRNGLSSEPVPRLNFKLWENAKRFSFYARDNADNFLRWCRLFGVHDAVLFESDNLVLHTQTRSVVLCLLEIGRIAAKYQLEPPGLVQLEREIEALGELSPSPASSDGDSSLHSSRSTTPTTPSYRPSELDKKVRKIADTAGTGHKITRISEGRYSIAGRTVFVRLLKDRHVMVRVGGGWDTLEHFLSRHEPCQVILVNRQNDKVSPLPASTPLSRMRRSGSSDSFLQFRAKYKPVTSPRWNL